MSLKPEDLCTDEAKYLLPFVQEAFKIQFDDCPDYSKFKFMLKSILLNYNIAPDRFFDWTARTKYNKV